jgi:hypothetical protein
MSSSYLSLCQILRREVGIEGSGPSTVVGQLGMMQKVVNWIADSDVAIQSRWIDWDFLWSQFEVNTIAGVKDISAPLDLGHWNKDTFYLDYDTDARKLSELSYKAWKTLYPNAKTTYRPSFFVIRPDKDVILHSVPDAIYALTAEYQRNPVRLAANTDVSPIPAKFDRLIIAQAKVYYAEHENAPEVMQAATNEYQILMHQLESLYLPGQSDRMKSHAEDMVIRVI